MDSVKTYRQVNREDSGLSFGISKMEDIYVKRAGKIDEPHRHDFYTVILTVKAKGIHLIDFASYALADQQIFFISPGQVHQVIEHEKSFGFAIVFSHEFLAQNNIPPNFIDDLNLFNDFGETPPLILNTEEVAQLTAYASEMWELNQSTTAFKDAAIGALLKLLLIRCNNLCSITIKDPQTTESGHGILRQFKQLINQNYTSQHATSDYAQALHISPDHLNRVVKSLTGKTAKEHIQSRIITAAKRLIYFTDLSNKEIGYELGFSEPANFSAFFKKCTGTSPSKFKAIG